MRKILMLVVIAVMLWPLAAMADSGMVIAPGSQLYTYPDVTVDTSCELVLQPNPDRRLEAFVSNTGSTNARCGDSNATSKRGQPVNANGGSWGVWTSAAIYCCAVSGTATIAPAETVK